jgi:uncharacterized protein (TIGR03032 family)
VRAAGHRTAPSAHETGASTQDRDRRTHRWHAGPPGADAPLRAVHTPNFPALLRRLGASLLVTTDQAGKLVMVRDEGDHLNTHFRTCPAPMGLALRGDRLAIGTSMQIWGYRDVPAVTAKLGPGPAHEACFLPRLCHVTGKVQVHEMAFSGDDLWFVNTRFSCLCTLDPSCSFAPRWRPPFVTALEPSDRCHRNDLAMADGRPRYVTALGATDSAAGWRGGKARGGVLLEVPSGEVVASGLSMPHSPLRDADEALEVIRELALVREAGARRPAPGRSRRLAGAASPVRRGAR